MDIKNIHKHSGWFSSYMNSSDGGKDPQGKALIICQQKKINKLLELIENIKGEIELCEEPKEFNEREVLESIKSMVNQDLKVEHTEGYFKWEG